MESETAEIDVAAPADRVWALVSDFGGLDQWMPGLESCTLDGDVRTIEMMGLEIKEQLVNRDDESRSIAYSIIEGPVPVDSHKATITVTPKGDEASHITWRVDVEPEGAAMFKDIYQGALGAVKAQLEG